METINALTDMTVAAGLAELRRQSDVELLVRLGGIASTFTIGGRCSGDPARLDGWTLEVHPEGGDRPVSLPLHLERFSQIHVVDGRLVATSGESRIELRRRR